MRVDDTGNQAQGCIAPTVSGPNGYCIAPTDYVNNAAVSTMTVNVKPGSNYVWWLHSNTPTPANSTLRVGTAFTCKAR